MCVADVQSFKRVSWCSLRKCIECVLINSIVLFILKVIWNHLYNPDSFCEKGTMKQLANLLNHSTISDPFAALRKNPKEFNKWLKSRRKAATIESQLSSQVF